MGSVKAIITGWAKRYGLLPVSEAEAKLAELRLSICKPCPFSAVSQALEIIDGQAKYENVIYCTVCKCPCKQKALVVAESCPKSRW